MTKLVLLVAVTTLTACSKKADGPTCSAVVDNMMAVTKQQMTGHGDARGPEPDRDGRAVREAQPDRRTAHVPGRREGSRGDRRMYAAPDAPETVRPPSRLARGRGTRAPCTTRSSVFPIRSTSPCSRTRPVARSAPTLKAALAAIESEVVEIPCVVGGERVHTGKLRDVVMPHRHQHVIARFHAATDDVAERAIKASLAARREWTRDALGGARGDAAARGRAARRTVARADERRDDARPDARPRTRRRSTRRAS